jgi:HAMP domain-containing protein
VELVSLNVWLVALALFVALAGFAATKNTEPPDREMLRMMDLLREMEMIKQIDMLQDMHNVEAGVEPVKSATPQKAAPGKKKETAK